MLKSESFVSFCWETNIKLDFADLLNKLVLALIIFFNVFVKPWAFTSALFGDLPLRTCSAIICCVVFSVYNCITSFYQICERIVLVLQLFHGKVFLRLILCR